VSENESTTEECNSVVTGRVNGSARVVITHSPCYGLDPAALDRFDQSGMIRSGLVTVGFRPQVAHCILLPQKVRPLTSRSS